MKKKKEYFYVDVSFRNGKTTRFQLPKDLQQPMRDYKREHPQNWQDLLLYSLINVPTQDYTQKNNYKPPIKPALVTHVYTRRKQQKKRTRSQFVTLTNWTTSSLRDVYLFLRHDHTLRSKIIIFKELWLWRRSNRLRNLKTK